MCLPMRLSCSANHDADTSHVVCEPSPHPIGLAMVAVIDPAAGTVTSIVARLVLGFQVAVPLCPSPVDHATEHPPGFQNHEQSRYRVTVDPASPDAVVAANSTSGVASAVENVPLSVDTKLSS